MLNLILILLVFNFFCLLSCFGLLIKAIKCKYKLKHKFWPIFMTTLFGLNIVVLYYGHF